MELSVIIPTKNEAEHLPACLAALRCELTGMEYEVVLIDHGSTDGTQQIAAKDGATVLHRPGAGSISELRNAGAAAASSDVLAFIDADVVVQPGWREGMRGAVAEGPNALCGDLYGIGADPSWIDRVWYDPAMRPNARSLPAGNMVMHRALFDRAGGFDVRLETGEDYDLCRRVEALGGTVRRLPALVTDHLGNPDTVRGFLLREAWHGAGDFISAQTVLASKVALTALAWAGLHALALILLPFSPLAALICWLAAVTLCLASAVAKYGVNRMLPARTLLYYAYFAGRSLSAWRRVRSLARRKPAPVGATA